MVYVHHQILLILSEFLRFYDQFFFLVLLEHENLARNIEIDIQIEFIVLWFHEVDWIEVKKWVVDISNKLGLGETR